MQWSPPVHSRNDSRMGEIEDVKACIVRAKRQPSPYLHQSVVEPRRHHQRRVRRELRQLDGTSQFLFPHQSRAIVEKPKRKVGVPQKQFVGTTPRQGPDRLVVIFAAKGMNTGPLDSEPTPQLAIYCIIPPVHFHDTPYLQCPVLNPIWLVHKHIRASTNRNLARRFINGHCLEGFRIIDVDRLEELLRAAEDDQRMARDVCLPRATKHTHT